jgi:ABC-type transport system substrate-binding protein
MNNPKVDRLIDLISAEVDDNMRRAYYHELQEIFYEEGTLLNVQVPFMVAISDKIVNYRHPLTMIPQYKYADIK